MWTWNSYPYCWYVLNNWEKKNRIPEICYKNTVWCKFTQVKQHLWKGKQLTFQIQDPLPDLGITLFPTAILLLLTASCTRVPWLVALPPTDPALVPVGCKNLKSIGYLRDWHIWNSSPRPHTCLTISHTHLSLLSHMQMLKYLIQRVWCVLEQNAQLLSPSLMFHMVCSCDSS